MRGKRLVARVSVLCFVVPLLGIGATAPVASAQDSRIAGGTSVPDGKYTFMASLRGRWGLTSAGAP